MIVGVLYGGSGREAEVSEASAKLVMQALQELGWTGRELRAGDDCSWWDKAAQCDAVINMVHGTGGEDGSYAAMLHGLQVPFSSAGAAGSAICFDKVLSKHFWTQVGGDCCGHRAFDLENYEQVIRFSETEALVVKPVAEGSSYGVRLCEDYTSLLAAAENVLAWSDRGMIEPCLPGREFTLGFVDQRYLGGIEIITTGLLYDYDAKYKREDTRFLPLDAELQAIASSLQTCCLAFQRLLAVEGPSRFDFRLDASGRAQFMEVNTVPGMTSHSLLPMAARESGLSYADLVREIVASARVKS